MAKRGAQPVAGMILADLDNSSLYRATYPSRLPEIVVNNQG